MCYYLRNSQKVRDTPHPHFPARLSSVGTTVNGALSFSTFGCYLTIPPAQKRKGEQGSEKNQLQTHKLKNLTEGEDFQCKKVIYSGVGSTSANRWNDRSAEHMDPNIPS